MTQLSLFHSGQVCSVARCPGPSYILIYAGQLCFTARCPGLRKGYTSDLILGASPKPQLLGNEPCTADDHDAADAGEEQGHVDDAECLLCRGTRHLLRNTCHSASTAPHLCCLVERCAQPAFVQDKCCTSAVAVADTAACTAGMRSRLLSSLSLAMLSSFSFFFSACI